MEMRVVVPVGASVHASQWPDSHEVDVRVEAVTTRTKE